MKDWLRQRRLKEFAMESRVVDRKWNYAEKLEGEPKI